MPIRTPLEKRKSRDAILADREKKNAKLRERRRLVPRKNKLTQGHYGLKPVPQKTIDKLLALCSLGYRNKEIAKQAGIGWVRFYKLLRSDLDFQTKWAMAKVAALEVMEDEIFEIADDIRRDYKNGRVDKEHINRSRLRIEVRKWMMKVRAPRKYGDKILADADGASKVSFTMEFGNDAPKPDAETIDGEAVDITNYEEAE